jgi:poly [ADP-ribose] polymerase
VEGDSQKEVVEVGKFAGMKVDLADLSDAAVSSASSHTKVDLSDVKSVPNPMDKVTAGLVAGDASLPLISVHVRAKIKDLVGQVVVLQEYRNDSSAPIEAKYVFPLDELAAVCGFEAFINGKHIKGLVKEKEQAHREYKQAISEGHGAYLMDEETPDVFTVSVGNLPPHTTAIIKITYVTELAVDGEDVIFTLPNSVAPSKKEKALKSITQSEHETIKTDSDFLSGGFSVQVFVEMATDILDVKSPTHPLRVKKTTTMATCELKDTSVSLTEEFKVC